ncbi:MAG TPA: hypothetical protein VMH34_05265 [Gammaproteobacteria bacterium]|nr:hypothetical protein [Gammaproteobacteria bacterium]
MNRKYCLLILCCMAVFPPVLSAAAGGTHRSAQGTDRSASTAIEAPPASPDEGAIYRCCTSSGMFPRYVNPDDRPRAAAREGGFCLAVMPTGQHIPGIVCHG